MNDPELRIHIAVALADYPQATDHDLASDVLDTVFARGDLPQDEIELAFIDYATRITTIRREGQHA